MSDTSQVTTDAAHAQSAAVQQDITKMGQDVSNEKNQVRNSPTVNLFLDAGAYVLGTVEREFGAAIIDAGVASAETGVGTLLIVAGTAVYRYGYDIQVTARQAFAADLKLLLSGGKKPQQPAPTPTPTPASVGTYSATLVPSSTDGNVPPDASQTLTLTLNADGSGSLSISPFAGTPLTVNFPAGTAQLGSDGSVSLSYGTASGVQISVTDAGLTNNSNALQGTFSIFSGDNNFDAANFDNATLNRQS